MAKNFRELEAQLPAEVRERAKLRAELAMAEMFLTEIRKVMQAADPNIFANEPAIQSQLDAQDDLALSSLYRIVKRLGGDLEIIAHLPNETIRFSQPKQKTQDAA